VPGLAIFAPVQVAEEVDGKPTNEIDFLVGNGGISHPRDKHLVIKLILHNTFVDRCGDALQEPTKDSNILILNSSQAGGEDQLQQVFSILSEQFSLKGLQPLNFMGIAKSC